MAGVAGLLLGWRPDEYWRATPDELAAVMEAARGGEDVAGVDGEALARMMAAMPD
nr:phage tail assembly chaperone [Sphingobium fontiphilum]